MPKSILIPRLLLAAILLVATTSFATAAPKDALQVARGYFEAMDKSDLDAAGALFVETSSIYESGGTEGTWQHYREHHLGPEIDAIKLFETTLGEPEVQESKDGSMAFIAWPIEYHIELVDDDREIDSKGTVTFVLVREDDQFRIRHLHWSSRRKK